MVEGPGIALEIVELEAEVSAATAAKAEAASALEASEASAPRAVSQRIDVIKRRVVNEVALAPWPRGNSIADTLAAAPGPLGSLLTALQQATVRLELDHAFSVEGDGSAGGGRRQAAAGSVVDLRLESVVRTLSGLPPPGAETHAQPGAETKLSHLMVGIGW